MLDHEFTLKPSTQYLVLMSVILLSSLIIMACLPINHWLRIGGFACILSYGSHILWRFGFLRSPHSILSIRRHHEGAWHLSTKHEAYQAELQGDSIVTSLVTILRFRIPERFFPHSCIIFQDSLKAEQYRSLLVLIKTE